MKNFIHTENVIFGYEDDAGYSIVLNSVSMDIPKGQFVAILGHNGSGKSTIAKHFNAILLPKNGTVIIDGMDTKQEEFFYDVRKKVGMVFQNPDNQIVATVVEEDVAFALENIGVEPKEMRKRVDEALQSVGMYDYRLHAPHQLSGGQKQRIAIAGMIAMRPDCIVLDEPTAMLDPQGRREVMKTIRTLNEQYGVTIILITHYMDEAAQCERVLVMDKGNVIFDDTPKKVFSNVVALKKVGLDVPQVTELIYELIQEGYPLPHDIITEQECIDALTKLLKE